MDIDLDDLGHAEEEFSVSTATPQNQAEEPEEESVPEQQQSEEPESTETKRETLDWVDVDETTDQTK